MSTKKFPTYWAWLPDSKDELVEIAQQNLEMVPFDQNAKANLDYIHSCLEQPDHSKLIAHHVTLFFNRDKNKDIVKEDDVLYVTFTKFGWSPTNVVFFGNVKKDLDGESINLLLENADRTHLTFSCDRGRGGKPVMSGNVIPYCELANPITIRGTVHELYTENSNKVHGGEPPVIPEKNLRTKQKVLSPQQIFRNLLTESNIPITPEMMKDFSTHCKLYNPSNDEIAEYVKNLI